MAGDTPPPKVVRLLPVGEPPRRVGEAWDVLSGGDHQALGPDTHADLASARVGYGEAEALRSSHAADMSSAMRASGRVEGVLRAACEQRDFALLPVDPLAATDAPAPPSHAPRLRALEEAHRNLARASGILQKRARRFRDASHALQRRQSVGQLLMRRSAADDQPATSQFASLEAMLAGESRSTEERMLQASALAWSVCQKHLPTQRDLVLLSLEPHSLRAGLLPWEPDAWVLEGTAENGASARAGHAVRFSVSGSALGATDPLPAGWVTNLLVGAACEAAADAPPHAPLAGGGPHGEVGTALRRIQHIAAVVSFASSCREKHGVEAVIQPLEPHVSRVVLLSVGGVGVGGAPPEKRLRWYVIFRWLQVVVRDPTGVAPDRCCGAEETASRRFLKSLAL